MRTQMQTHKHSTNFLNLKLHKILQLSIQKQPAYYYFFIINGLDGCVSGGGAVIQ